MRMPGLRRLVPLGIGIAALAVFPAPAPGDAPATEPAGAALSAPVSPEPQPGPEGGPVARAIGEGYLGARRDGKGGVAKGPLHLLDSITVAGAAGFTAERLGIAAFAGRPASSAELKALSGAIRAYLADHGHPFAEASLDFSVRAGEPRVDLTVTLRPGPGYKYGGTKQTGSRTRPETLERLTLLRFGEAFSEARLALAIRRLSRTGYFEAVIPGPLYRDSTRNLLYPSLALTDLKGNRLGGILGYDSEKEGGGGLNGYLDIHLINMRGTARDLDFAFEAKSTGTGPQEKEARFAYTEPWILGTSLGGRIDLELALQDSVYEERNAAFSLFQDMGFHSRYSVHFAQQANRDFAAGVRSTAFSTGLGLQYDTRDRVPGTLRGLRYQSRVTALRRELPDSSYYMAQTVHSLGLWANRGRWVGHALLSAGGNAPLEGRSNRGELFQIGGANTLRGFREKEFLTNLYAYANLEIQFLLAPWSRASVFAVPGLVNRLGGDVHWRRVIGYGAGLEAGGKDWTFGVSYALNPDRGPGDGFVHLRVTNNF